MAQLYKEEFSKQEKAKEEHLKQAKEKAIAEETKERERLEKEASEARAREQAERDKQLDRERVEQEALQRAESTNNTNVQDTPSNAVQAPETPVQSTSSVIGSDWSQVSPEQASQYMSARTNVPASTWQAIIYAESTNNPYVTNRIGCYGYLQLHPVHGNVSGMTPQQYLDTAVGVFNSQGLKAWEVTTNGMVG